MPQSAQTFEPGQFVAVTQQIPQANDTWTVRVEGEVVRYEQKKTGSWYAHSKDDRLWLDRLVIRKADGEIVSLSLDANTHIDRLEPPAPPETPEVAEEQSDDAAVAEGEADSDDAEATKDAE